MARITLTWNPKIYENTKVTFSSDFDGISRIEKLDFLQDAICDLEERYNQELSGLNEDFENARKRT